MQAGGSGDEEAEGRISKRQRVAQIKERLAVAMKTGQRICVDLSMEHLMSEKVNLLYSI